ncbi:MAG: LysM peptidoglycan-binding domain-containing protein, partial [Anaerolineae bacterium]
RSALSLRPQDGEVKAERELAGLYLQAQVEFTNRRWTEVIAGLEFVNRQDPDYAQGTARQILYEAYVARGDGAMAGGAYQTALDDYQRAAVLADQDPEAVLRLYEAHIKVAEAHGAQQQFEAGVLQYRTAAEVGNLRSRGQQSPALAAALAEAERFAAAGNFSVAFEKYQQAVRVARWSRSTASHVVQPGDYLTMLASRYGSTVNAIVLANEIADPNLIFPGEELLIPVLP